MLDFKAAKMEAALLGGLIRAIVPKLISLGHERYKLHKSVKSDIEFLVKELRLIVGSIDDGIISERGADDRGAVSGLLIEDLRELAFGIEDFLDSLMYHSIWKQQPASFQKIVRLPKMLRARLQFAGSGERRRLRNLTMEAYERRKRFPTCQQPSAATAPMGESPSPVFHPRNVRDTDLVGVDELRADLLEQLADAKGQMKVISIVGFCGMGKTAVAAQVYNRETDGGRFEKHAWVCAAGKRPTEVLTDVLSELNADTGSSKGTPRELCEDIRNQLHNKRYLIVIDDIQTEDMWGNINSAFPDNNGFSSRILVTTTIRPVAIACSSAASYMHKMRRLDEGCSKQLFAFKTCPEEYSCYRQPDSEAILKKCGGQPLALVTIGEFLKKQGWPIGPSCEDICNKLHYHLENDRTFEAMRRVLIRNYISLPNQALKACLLYFGMFPCDYQIKRKSLLRLWLAEGFVELQPSTTTPDPATAFDMLKDRNIIEPIYISNNENVKTCQTYSMMHEFILHMSVSENFVTLLCDEMTEHKYVRRLSLHKSAAVDGNNLDTNVLSLVRSLTVFGKPSEGILDFSKYRLLRVLDLERCDDLNDNHVKNICCLLLLKYLSLGKNVTKLPKDISKLTLLETLDLRASMVAKLRAEVFHMPCLVHLFGKFRLTGAVDFPKQQRSVLQTLAGFITDGSQSYSKLVDHMIKLRKVKVWCESSTGAGATDWNNLQEAIQRFIEDKNVRNIGDRSLSLHFDRAFKNSLNSLKEPCYLSSLKLHGELDALPQFVISLRGLKELCLSSIKFTTGFLEALTQLSELKYLKLTAGDLEKFTIKAKAFPSLLRLCFVLQHPTFPTIQEGSMKHLKTLQLVCKDLHGLCGIKMEYMKLLKEVILHDGVDPNTWVEWEEAAKEHPNKPKVLPSKTAEISKWEPTAKISKWGPPEGSDVLLPPKIDFRENSTTSIGSAQDKFTSMPVNQGLESSAEPRTHSISAAQASSDDRTNASFNHMGDFEVSPLTTLSNNASSAENEAACIQVELTKDESANNSALTVKTIEQTNTQIRVNHQSGSIGEPKRQNTDIQNHALSMGFSEDSLSTELSIAGHDMVSSHTLQGC